MLACENPRALWAASRDRLANRAVLAVVRVESNPQLVQIVPPNEVVILISFELTIGEMRGMLNLCIPFNSIERIGGGFFVAREGAAGIAERAPSERETSRGVCPRGARRGASVGAP